MSMEQERRARFRDQAIPTTWELGLAAAVGIFMLAGVVPFVGQGAVAAVATGSYAWPDAFFPAIGALFGHGEFGHGLPPSTRAQLPAPGVMWAVVALLEVVTFLCLVVVVNWVRDALGLGDRTGLATPAQAAQALGVGRLRDKAGVVRPDLYGQGSDRGGRRR